MKRFIGCLCLLTGLSVLAKPSWAQSPKAEQPAPSAIVVVVQSDDPGVEPGKVREVVSRELGVTVLDADSPNSVGTLQVKVKGDAITLNYRSRDGATLVRSVDRPGSAAESLEVIRLLAGNLARDEAAELLRGLPAKRTTPQSGATAADVSEATPPPATAPSSEKALPTPPKRAAKHEAEASARAAERKAETPTPWNKEPLAFDASLFHPIAIHADSHERTVNVELALVYARLGRLEGVGLSLGALRSDAGAEGAGFALWNDTRGDSQGAFFSYIFSTGGAGLEGVESAGVFNYRSGAVRGAQLSGVYNQAGELRGVQASGLVNVVTDRPARGVQAAGIYNHAPSLSGGQIGLVNHSAGDIEGLQFGLVSVGRDVNGGQAAFVNVAREVEGLQLGLVNVAKRVDGLSFAPVSVISEGRTSALAWADSVSVANVGVRYSSSPLYSLFGVGFAPRSGSEFGTALAGIGVHAAEFGAGFVDADAHYRAIYEYASSPADVSHSAVVRGVIGMQVGPVGIFAAAGGEYCHGPDYSARSGPKVDMSDDQGFRPYLGAGLSVF
ncbi:MAG: hypothetical protein R3B13_26025 [Polyangiaceae bacterium]